jgi:hypothetical protein
MNYGRFSSDTERLIEYLATGSGIVLANLDAVEKIWRQQTEECWSHLAG